MRGLILVIAVFTLFSCEKENNETAENLENIARFEGIVQKIDTGEPMADMDIELILMDGPISRPETSGILLIDSTFTDASGYFSFETNIKDIFGYGYRIKNTDFISYNNLYSELFQPSYSSMNDTIIIGSRATFEVDVISNEIDSLFFVKVVRYPSLSQNTFPTPINFWEFFHGFYYNDFNTLEDVNFTTNFIYENADQVKISWGSYELLEDNYDTIGTQIINLEKFGTVKYQIDL